MPDVAMTLALLGTRFSKVGMTLSAPWSNLFCRRADRCLRRRTGWDKAEEPMQKSVPDPFP